MNSDKEFIRKITEKTESAKRKRGRKFKAPCFVSVKTQDTRPPVPDNTVMKKHYITCTDMEMMIIKDMLLQIRQGNRKED